MDERSLVKGDKPHYESRMMFGSLFMDEQEQVHVTWKTAGMPMKIMGGLAESGRGMELSELVLWNGQMLAFDDRTGIVYELITVLEDGTTSPLVDTVMRHKDDDTEPRWSVKPLPRYVLTEDPNSVKGMKVEWACEVDGDLMVGSFGKEYTTGDGSQITGEANFWVARIEAPRNKNKPGLRSNGSPQPIVEKINWKGQYNRLRELTRTSYPGYMIHEAVNYSDKKKKWFFLPRRISKEQYDEVLDESRGASLILEVDPSFSDLVSYPIDFAVQQPHRGFSSFKFMPGTNDEIIIAVRSVEVAKRRETQTFLSVFDVKGKVYMNEVNISEYCKYEGLEIW